MFIDDTLPLKAIAHAAKCYAMACDKAARLAARNTAGPSIDARPVSASGGVVEVNGADAIVIAAPYFGGPPAPPNSMAGVQLNEDDYAVLRGIRGAVDHAARSAPASASDVYEPYFLLLDRLIAGGSR